MADILLIGYDLEIARLTSRVIERNGFKVEIMTDPLYMPLYKPQVLIFDCDMPPRTGFEKYDKLIKKCFPAKILWVSSNEKDEISALELGADDWIKKPFHIDVFIARIKKLCRKIIRI